MADPTQARVCALFNYDPETGLLSYKERPRSEFQTPATHGRHMRRVGTEAGCVDDLGYQRIVVDGRATTVHKVAWLIMTGEWVPYPDFEIDHINGDRKDNRWSNLRKVTKSGNQRNGSKRVNNTSGVHGVNWKPKPNGKGSWVARIWNGPRHVYLGAFQDIAHAKIARKAAERVLGFTGTERDPYAGAAAE